MYPYAYDRRVGAFPERNLAFPRVTDGCRTIRRDFTPRVAARRPQQQPRSRDMRTGADVCQGLAPKFCSSRPTDNRVTGDQYARVNSCYDIVVIPDGNPFVRTAVNTRNEPLCGDSFICYPVHGSCRELCRALL